MRYQYTAKIELPMPPPVVMEYVSNPWLFFNPMGHVVVLKKITDDRYDVVYAPDIEQTKGSTFYGILNGPTIKPREVTYTGESLGHEIKMNINISLTTEPEGTAVNIDWELSTEFSFFDRFRGENFTLNPEHIIKKHLILRIPEMINLINYKEQGREFLLETSTLSGSKAIPYIKQKAQEIKDCIVIGTSKGIKFTISVRDEKLETIKSESGNKESYGGEAILEILNYPDLVDIGIYDISAEKDLKDLMDKQLEKSLLSR